MIKTMLGVARLNFLTLSLACVFLVLSYSLYLGAPFNVGVLILVVTMAIAAHISVNAFNEYFDFRSGLDFLTPKTPFSGGSGALVADPSAARWALLLAVFSLMVVIVLGLVLVVRFGAALLWIGIPGVLVIYTYTHYLNRSAIACLLAPGVGFGLLMTLGAFWLFISAGSMQLSPVSNIPLGGWILALMVTVLVSNLLLVNQFPDLEADKKVGRRHLPIVIGRKRSTLVVLVLHSVAIACLVIGVLVEALPTLTLLVLVSSVLLVKLILGLYRLSEQWHLETAVPLLATNVAFVHIVILATALLLLLA